MERYHAFPGTGDGDKVPALDVSRELVFSYARVEGTDPKSLTVMRKDDTGQLGTWVKFTDALKRSRHEYDEGYKAAKNELTGQFLEGYARERLKGYNQGRTSVLHVIDGSKYDEGYEAGLAKGRKEGQVKIDAISEISSAQLAKEYERGHEEAFDSMLAELVDSHKAETTYQGELAKAEGVIDEVVALLREYQDVLVSGPRGVELAVKLTAFVNENG